MGVFVRFLETITGKPHRHEQSRMVSEVADQLSSDVAKLSTRLRPYLESEDPLVALMTDVFNQRQMRSDDARSRER